MNKKDARKTGLAARAAIPEEIRKQKSKIVEAQIISRIQPDSHVGCFVSMRDEIETDEIISYCLKNNIALYVPKVKHKKMYFCPLHDLSQLEKGGFGVMEPKEDNFVDASVIDLMIVPLSSFDHENHRTGYGAGYYDSVLTDKHKKIGVAFKEQEVDYIETDPWDVTLDEIITA